MAVILFGSYTWLILCGRLLLAVYTKCQSNGCATTFLLLFFKRLGIIFA